MFFVPTSRSGYPEHVLSGCADVRLVGTDEQIGGRPVIEFFREGKMKILKATPHPGKDAQVRHILARLRELEMIEPLL